MIELKTTRLTVAKLCHEISGCLSIMKFLEEDLEASQSTEDLKMLFNEVDIISFVMDFFRNIYSSSNQKTEIHNVIANLYKIKNITLNNLPEIFQDFKNGNEENILAGILYIILKSCRAESSVFVCRTVDIVSVTTENASLSYSIINALNNDDAEEDIFNVFAKYIKAIATSEGYVIKAESLLNGGVSLVICKL